MREEIGNVDAQKILDSIKSTTVREINNALSCDMQASIGGNVIPPDINQSINYRNTLIPFANSTTHHNDILLYTTQPDDESDSQNIWVFQDTGSDGNLVKYYVGSSFSYKNAVLARGDNGGGGNKVLMFTPDPSGDKPIALTIYKYK
ncbi:hypothetical protein [Photorhabdus australis]|uniref:hypothetical protein n=1 Tax=Photorhabdus australis TaxID=286156 RepID=UPI00056464E5|nr:hypothetical protein [Photorhabdus australis]